MSGLKAFGAQRIWKGFRTGDQKMLLAGAGALFVVWLRRPRGRTLLHSEEVAPGETITITAKPRKTPT